MKQNYFSLKFYFLFACIFFAGIFSLTAQVKNDFEVRYQDNIKGDITFIGNNIVNREVKFLGWIVDSPNEPYNGWESNDDLNMQYIDVDGDDSTFSSSSADLSIPDLECSKVVYAGLYWSAVYKYNEGNNWWSGREDDWDEVKFKTPGGTYQNLKADEVLFDGEGDSDFGNYSPYACYTDVTKIIQSLENPTGEYTVADVRASVGYGKTKDGNFGLTGGISGGWSLVIVYENPTLIGKKITTFDGYAGIKSGEDLKIPVKGFNTLPEGFPVNAKMGVMALEGDRGIPGDQLKIKADSKSGYTNISNNVNPEKNFFNGSISTESNGNGGEINYNRNPNSQNTLGWDVDLFEIDNPGNSVIPNDETGVTLHALSTQDKYDIFFTSFDVEIIEPDIKLVKGVYNLAGESIQGQEIQLGQEIKYTLTFDNIGNDDGTGFSIRDKLPLNVNFLEDKLVLPDLGGVNSDITYNYDYNTNEIVFQIPDKFVEVVRGGDKTVTIDEDYTIEIFVQVQEDCDKLRNACSNIIENLAYASYSGVLNDNEISDDPSVLGITNCLFDIPGATNFIPAIDLCGLDERTIELCGESIELTAGSGYDRYQWSELDASGQYVDIPGETGQTFTATTPGTYKVDKQTDNAACKDFEEIIHVNIRGTDNTSPFADVADQLVTCTNDGTLLPIFNLCGTNDDRLLSVNFPDAVKFSWQKLNGCEDVSVEECPTKDNSCTWDVLLEGENLSDYMLSGPGEYRLEVTYQNGCFNRFYFKAYENSVSPVVTHKDMACGKPGNIEISNVGSGYQFAIHLGEEDLQADELTWQESSFFEVTTAGVYGVYIRQNPEDLGEEDGEPCLFRGEDVVISDLVFSFTAIPTAPMCVGGKGSIDVSIGGALPHYSFWLKDVDGNIIEEKLASQDNYYQFSDQSPGTYTVEVATVDGCRDEISVTIPEAEKIDFTATGHDIACDDGSVTLNVVDGEGSYNYAIWSYVPGPGATKPAVSYNDVSEIPATEYFTGETFIVPEGEQGTYQFIVVNSNNCNTLSNEVTVNYNPPIQWSLSGTDLTCFQSNDGVITVDHGDTNGYTLTYQLTDIEGNLIESEDGVFNNLPAGRNYKIVVTQTYGDQSCSSEDVITLTEPDRLTASAGVSKLPGCNDSDIELAEVRITNPLGGTPPYEYSFDNGVTYGSSAIGYLKADTHTVYVKDLAGCTFPMTIVIPELPLAPTADPTFTYNCDGTGNVSLIPSIPDYEYTYDIDGVPVEGDFESGFTYDNLEDGPHTITVHYNNPNYATYANLLNEDFGRGANTTSPYIDPKYVYESQYDNDYNPNDPEGVYNIQINDGEYSVTSKIRHLFYGWTSPIDHTNPLDPYGRYMAINIGGVAGVNGVIFKKRVFDVIPHQKISVELEAFNLIGEGSENRDDPFLLIQLVGTDGQVINQIETERIPRHTDAHSWINYAVELNPEDNDELDIVIRTQNDEESGNDIAIDDIKAFQIPAKCDLTIEVPFTIESKPFAAKIDGVTDALCSGADNGSIEFSVANFDSSQGYQYSIDNGVTWSAVITTSPFTISDLSAADYTIMIRDVRDTENCVVTLEERIEDPSPLNLSAEVTTPMSCSNNYTAVITVTAEGGNGNFEYRLEGENGYVVDYQADNVFTVTGLANIGDYTISVRDENNCVSPTDATVTLIAPKEVEFDLTTDQCIVDGNGIIYVDVTSGNGTYQFSLDNVNWFIPNATTPLEYTFDGLVPGNPYTVYVKDEMGCSFSETITLDVPLTLEVDDQTSISCYGYSDGTLTLNVNNFETSYTYSLDGVEEGNTYTSNTLLIEDISSGMHTIIITDINGCTVSHNFEIASPTLALSASFDITEITCESKGSVTVTAQDGWGSYTYELSSTDGTVSVGPQSESTFTNLDSGDYEIIVRDAGGCEFPLTFSITDPTPPEVILSPKTDLCNSDAGVVLIANASGGKVPYQYQLNGGELQSSNEFTVYQAGNYTVKVVDANGCTDTNETAVIISEELQARIQLDKDLDCSGSPDAVIRFSIQGGYPNYTMEVFKDGTSIEVDVPVADGDVYNTDTEGSYHFVITDSEGCIVETNTVLVTPNVAPTVTENAVNPLCVGAANGSIELQVTGGTAPYTIVINGSTTNKLGGLIAGTYSYTMTDAKGCITPGEITLEDPNPLDAGTINIIQEYRCDNTSATIELTGFSGGTVNDSSDYEFSLDNSNYQSSPIFNSGILPGDYTIYIRDLNGCVESAQITIAPLNEPTGLNFSATALTCPDLNSDVTVTVTDGNPPYTYEIIAASGSVINNGNNNVFTDLVAGTYRFRVTDDKGCTIEDNYTVEDISQIDVDLSAVQSKVCTGESTGIISVDVSNFGSASYKFLLEDDSGNEIDSGSNQSLTSFEVNGLGEGTYTITVTDLTTNCTATDTIIISAPDKPLSMSLDFTPVTCVSNGTITVSAKEGWEGYTYRLVDNAGVEIRPYQPSNVFTNVPAGDYVVWVKDIIGCEVSDTILIEPAKPPKITAEASSDFCYDSTDRASITVKVSGGQAPFRYQVNGGEVKAVTLTGDEFTITDLTPGDYTIVVYDDYGCEANVITETIGTQLTATSVVSKTLDCTANPDALIEVEVSGGYPPYTYEVSSDVNVNWTEVLESDLPYKAPDPGTYTFRITDTKGCTITTEKEIAPISMPVISNIIPTEATCYGSATGSLEVNIDQTKGVAPYTIEVFEDLGGGTTGKDFGNQTTNLPAGDYIVVVTDAKGCFDEETATIGEPEVLDVDIIATPISCAENGSGTQLGSISVTVNSGGTDNFTVGLYDGFGNLVPTTASNPMTNVAYNSNILFDELNYGEYIVRIVDENGCVTEEPAIVETYTDILIEFSGSPACEMGTGSIKVTANNSDPNAPIGTGSFYFALVPNAPFDSENPTANGWYAGDPSEPNSYTFTNLDPGVTYTFVVHDDHTNCEFTQIGTVQVSPQSNMEPEIDGFFNVTCKGAADGYANFTVTGFDPVASAIEYQVYNASDYQPIPGASGNVNIVTGETEVSGTVTDLVPGEYYIMFEEVGGANDGCVIASETFNISESLEALTLSVTTTNDNCHADAGSITTTASHGTPPYKYQYLASGAAAPIATDPTNWTPNSTFYGEAGEYDVYVMDKNGCIVDTPATINADPTPVITVGVKNNCITDPNNYTLLVTLTTVGTGVHYISVDSEPFEVATGLTVVNDVIQITGLSAGKHTISVKDANGCGDTQEIQILPPLVANKQIVAQPHCNPNDNGEITISVTGGSGDFTYDIISGPVLNTTGDANGIYTGLEAGKYVFSVTDNVTNCTVDIDETLTTPPDPTFNLTATDVGCYEGSDGTITVILDPSNIDGPYTYDISLGGVDISNTTGDATGTYTGLEAGNYEIMVTSSKGCEVIKPIPVGEPADLEATATASAYTCDQDYSLVTVTVEGINTGTPSYEYSFDGGATFQEANTKTFPYGTGTVNVVVMDANGCTFTTFTVVPDEIPLDADIIQDTAITCSNAELVDIVISSGSGNYTVTELLSGNPVLNLTGISLTEPGTYVYKVVDDVTNCFVIIEHTVNPYDLIDVTANLVVNETCSDSENGRISITVSGYTGDYNYRILDNFGNEVEAGTYNEAVWNSTYELPYDLSSGLYHVEVTATDSPYCSTTSNTVTITQPDPIQVEVVTNVNANCNKTSATVTVVASGGSGTFSYAAVAKGTAPVDADYSTSNTLNLDPSISDWDVYVKDSEGCVIISPLEVSVSTDTAPEISLSIVDQCVSENTYEVQVNLDTPGVGPYQLIVDGGAPMTVTGFPVILPDLSSGNHQVQILDNNSCGETKTIPILAPLKLSVQASLQPSCSLGGTIDFVPSGGSGSSNYLAELLNSDGSTTSITANSNQFVNVPAGDYIVRITDINTNCFIERPISLELATPVTFNWTKTDVSCHNGANGSILVQLDATNDQPPYTYVLEQIDALGGSVIPGGVTKTQNGGDTIFTGLEGGFYRVTVSSGRGCSDFKDIEIVNPPLLGISAELYGNCTVSSGYSIQVELTDIGTAPYNLLVNGTIQDVSFDANGFAVIENLTAGDYTIEIIDANGCRATAATTVSIIPLNFNRSLTTLLDCQVGVDGNAEITISEVSGSGSYEYIITDPNGVAVNGSFTGTSLVWAGVTMPGEYTIGISDDAAAGNCIVEKTIIVPEKLLPDFELTGYDALCYGVNNGTIYASAIDNGTGPYTFEIVAIDGAPITAIPSNETTPGYHANFSNLLGSDAGIAYTVRATSTTNACYTDLKVTLKQAAPVSGFSASVTDFGCSLFNNSNNAVVSVTTPSGGSGVYRYVFVYDYGTPGDTSDDIVQNSTRTEFVVSNPAGGSVTASILDSNGCTSSTVNLTVEPYVELEEIQTVITQPTCLGADGSVLVQAILVDAVLGIDNDRLQYDIVSADGSYTDSVILDSNDASPLDHRFDNLAVGGYTITVTNLDTGCQISKGILLNDPNTFDVEVTKIQDVQCYGSETGIVDLQLIDKTYSGGYTWTIYNAQDDTVVKTGDQTNHTGITLYAGAYYASITQSDIPFCVKESYFNIIQSDQPLAIDAKVSKSISCTDLGEITVTASGGYGFYEFRLVDKVSGSIVKDWSTQNKFTSISEGTYDVFVRDDKGCDEVFQTLTLIQPTQITAQAIQGDVIYCDGEMTASVEVVNVTGGRPEIDPTAGYLYVLNRLDSNGNIISSTSAQTNHVFTGLQAGNYSVKVFDNFGCDVLTNAVLIAEPDQVIASLGLVKGNTCTTGAKLILTAEGGTDTGYEYSTSANGPWMPFGAGNTVEIDVPGVVTAEQVHNYYVRDSNLCISMVSNSVTLLPVEKLELTPTVVSDVSCYGDSTGYIKVEVEGGLGNYKYTLIDALRNVTLVDRQDGNTFSGLTSGVYYVQVDSEDCSEQIRVEIEQGKELTAKTPVVDNPICTDGLGRIEVELVGGTGEYQFAISPNLDQFQSKNVFEDLAPGTYTIIAQDSRGCNPFVFKEEIIAPAPLVAKANILNQEFCVGDGTGSFELNIQGGTPPYSTAVNTQDDDAFEQDRRVFNGLKGGETYVVFVRDANGCQQNVVVTLKDPVDLTPRAEVSVGCVSNASVNQVEIILAQQGLEDVIYTLDGGADQFENKFTDVAPGAHIVTVSYQGCQREVEFTVDPVQPLNLTVNESNLNEFTMYPSGGQGPYEYFVDGVSQGSEASYVIKVSGVYEVMIIDANGCQQIAQIDMEFIDIEIPNVFTPNGDGNNDYWPPSNYGQFYPNIITKIYDRYGRVVGELRQGDNWDGRYNGTELPTGDYWYVMKLNGVNDDREFVGHFTLYR